MRRLFSILALALLLLSAASHAGEVREATLYKNPWCGCCTEYGRYLEAHGFEVTVEDTDDLAPIKRQAGVPEGLEGCHTLMVDGYAVEGHVPVEVLLRMLAEKPDVRGISLPGMPAGSPGMSGEKAGPFTIWAFGENEPEVYAVE